MFGLQESLSILLALRCTTAAVISAPDAVVGLGLDEISRRYTRRTEGGLHLPIVTGNAPRLEKRGSATAAIGLGDYLDVTYSVLISIGGITTPLILDTGSSDLWVMSDACTEGCTGGVTVYPQSSFKYSGIDVALLYGDSSTGTFAQGKVGGDIVDLAGLKLDNQYFGAINKTNTSIAEAGSAGIFGVGFPINSVIWGDLYLAQHAEARDSGLIRREEDEELALSPKPEIKLGAPFPKHNFNFYIPKFPTVPGLLGGSPSSSRHETRQATQTTSSSMFEIFASYTTLGPFLPRLIASSVLAKPMISVTLQRDSIDVGGNVGTLSIGELPTGIANSSMTWAPLRLYTSSEKGLPAPPNAPHEVYPLTWEVMLDGVYFDGELLPESTLSDSSIELSALIDTGNSLIRGPADVIARIKSSLGSNGLFPCSTPHTLAFKIGGKMFPVDPRDFAAQAFQDNVRTCSSNLAATDAPTVGGYQFGWSLGTPFLKGVLSSYYFGNLTYPSQDLPKIGFLSTVPSDADQKMKDAVAAAANVDGNFPAISEPAPSGTAKNVPTNSDGIAQSTASSTKHVSNTSSSAFRVVGSVGLRWNATAISGVTLLAILLSTSLSI